MDKIKKIKLYTLFFHSIIVIGAGHGIGIMILYDFWSIPLLFKNGIENNLNAEYQDRLKFVGLISAVGKIMILLSLFVKINKVKNLTALIGILLLWISVYFLTSGNWLYDWLYGFTFLTSVPFLFASIKLISLILKNQSKQKTEY